MKASLQFTTKHLILTSLYCLPIALSTSLWMLLNSNLSNCPRVMNFFEFLLERCHDLNETGTNKNGHTHLHTNQNWAISNPSMTICPANCQKAKFLSSTQVPCEKKRESALRAQKRDTGRNRKVDGKEISPHGHHSTQRKRDGSV